MAKQNAPLTTPQQEEKARAIYNALNQSNDTFEQRIKVLKLKKTEGKAKVDKDGNAIVDDFGEVEKWEDTYSLTYVAMNSGGEHTIRITQTQYLELKLGEIYVAKGHIEYRLYKDNFNTTAVIVFDSFTPAIELFVSAMLKFEGLEA